MRPPQQPQHQRLLGTPVKAQDKVLGEQINCNPSPGGTTLFCRHLREATSADELLHYQCTKFFRALEHPEN